MTYRHVHNDLTIAVALFVLGSNFISAQCGEWLQPPPFPGVLGTIASTTLWDEDAEGPLPPAIVLSGSFQVGGDVVSHKVVAWVPATGQWRSLAPQSAPLGFDVVSDALGCPDGRLVLSGARFDGQGHIAIWNGAEWDLLDTEDFAHQLHGLARGIAALPDGELLVVGAFSVESVNCTIARWNGSRWIAVNTNTPTGGNQNSSVVLAHSSGQVFINRRELFAPLGQETIEAWDGISWRIVGTLAPGSADPNTPTVRAMAELANGDIVVAGNIGGVGAVAAENMLRWDGQAWSALSGGFTRPVNALAILPNGDLIAGGIFASANGSPFERLARWDGVAWASIGAGTDRNVNTVTALPDNSFFASGAFEHVGSEFAYRVARFDNSGGESLSSPAHAVIGPIHSIHAFNDDHWYASGYVQYAGGQVAGTTIEHLASGWLPLAGGLSGGSSSATAITQLQNGSIVYAGSFTNAGAVSASNIARWDGSAWRRLRGGLNFPAEAAIVMPSGDLFVGGYFGTADGVATGGIARWDGANWFSLGGSQPVIVHALVALDNGDLIIGGRFSSVGGLTCNSVARWNGSTWFPLGSGIGGGSIDINALAVLPNGDIVAGGNFEFSPTLRNIVRWDGTTWGAMGGGLRMVVYDLASTPDGQVLAAGTSEPEEPAEPSGIARWDGHTWQKFGAGTDAAVNGLTKTPGGDVVIVGEFHRVDQVASPYWARWRPGVLPVVAAHPEDASTCVGGGVVFSCVVDGTESHSYQWQIRDPLAADTWLDLLEGAVMLAGVDAGIAQGAITSSLRWTDSDYSSTFGVPAEFRCRISNGCGFVDSASAFSHICPNLADVNCDARVDLYDLATLLSSFGLVGGPPLNGDFDNSGQIDINDLAVLLSQFGQACP